MRRYGTHLEGPASAFFLVLSNTELGTQEKDAIDKSAKALGWADGPSYVPVKNGDENALSPADVFEIVEGLDPICIVIVGNEAREIAGQAFRCEVPAQGRFRLFGRDACAFNNLANLLESEAGKKTVWALLRGLPHASS